MIFETIITTLNPEGAIHIAPMGVRRTVSGYLIAPFRPSTTLENLAGRGSAVINMVDDVRVFAGCLTGHRQWPARPAALIDGRILEAALAHVEVQVERLDDDPVRPEFHCRVVAEQSHRPFAGFNRAQAAVIEGAILVSRLHMLPEAKLERELAYLQIAVDKTAGEREREAWEWLMQRVAQHRQAAAQEVHS